MRRGKGPLVAAALTVVVVLGAIAYFRSEPVQSGSSTDDFLEEARLAREAGQGSTSTEGLLAAKEGGSTEPRIEVPTNEFDVGVISHKEATVKELLVKNSGGRPLIISDIRTTCGCTTGHFASAKKGEGGKPVTTILPGHEETLLITIDPFRIPSFTSSKTLTLQTNDPARPAMDIIVKATVDPEFVVPEDELRFGEVEQGKPAEKTMVMKQTGEDFYEITSIEPGARVTGTATISAAVKPMSDEGGQLYTLSMSERPKDQWSDPKYKEWNIHASISGDLPPGLFTDHIWLATTAPRYKKLRITLSAMVTSFYKVDPSIMSLRSGVLPGDEDVTSVTVSADQPLEISELSITGDDLIVRSSPGDTANSVKLNLSIAPSSDLGLKNEVLTFDVKVGGRTAKHTMRTFVSVKKPS
ncbi:MAG: hypothetical protein AMXMBFR84_18800 [Candidatus Hydrogenedentota bacterium]